MPLRDEICHNPRCPWNGVVEERFYHSQALGPRPCEHCQGEMERIPSRFGVVWTGPIDQRYRDKTKDGYYEPAGMTQWTRNTPDGKPQPVRLETWQDVKQYARENGCTDPRDVGNNVSVGEDGKTLNAGMGQPGVEV